jgi:hypothetical protein
LWESGFEQSPGTIICGTVRCDSNPGRMHWSLLRTRQVNYHSVDKHPPRHPRDVPSNLSEEQAKQVGAFVPLVEQHGQCEDDRCTGNKIT